MNGNTRLAHFPYIAQAFARALKNGVFFCFRPAHARKGRACMRDDCCGLRPFGVMRPVPASPRAGFGRLKARPRSTIYVSYAPSPRGSPAASRRRLARVVVRVGPIATRAHGTPRRACATYKGVEISVLNAPIPDVSLAMDGKFHDIPFFGNDVVVRVRDTHVPNRNVHVIYLARKMIGLKKA